MYSPSGEVLHGPAFIGWPEVIGADATLYAFPRALDTNSASVHANPRDLKRQWSLDLGQPCLERSPVLADNGVMYIVRSGIEKTSTKAVQTGKLRSRTHGHAHAQPRQPTNGMAIALSNGPDRPLATRAFSFSRTGTKIFWGCRLQGVHPWLLRFRWPE